MDGNVASDASEMLKFVALPYSVYTNYCIGIISGDGLLQKDTIGILTSLLHEQSPMGKLGIA
jgi:hypothetical protein